MGHGIHQQQQQQQPHSTVPVTFGYCVLLGDPCHTDMTGELRRRGPSMPFVGCDVGLRTFVVCQQKQILLGDCLPGISLRTLGTHISIHTRVNEPFKWKWAEDDDDFYSDISLTKDDKFLLLLLLLMTDDGLRISYPLPPLSLPPPKRHPYIVHTRVIVPSPRFHRLVSNTFSECCCSPSSVNFLSFFHFV